jgi:hypothetical protein
VQVGTYPTRNFARGLIQPCPDWTDATPLDDIPACRHADGTISSSGVPDVWRMASEDSEQLVSRFPSIHRLHDLDDLRKPMVGLVVTCCDALDTRSELLEVEPFCSPERILPKERDDALQ